MGNTAAAAGFATAAVLAAAADDGSESLAVPGKHQQIFIRDDLRNQRPCKVSF